MNFNKNRILTVLFIFLVIYTSVVGQTNVMNKPETNKAEEVLPKPDISNGKYGELAANTFDFWKPESKKPTPLVVFIHGGGLFRGDKSQIPVNQLKLMLKAGLAVMSINYRLTGEAVFPQHYMDCARAIQYARFKAKELNINPDKIGASGRSAGAMTALWIGFNDDFADNRNSDPVLRQSTRLKVIINWAGQTTLVPELVRKYVGEMATQMDGYFSGAVFGLTKEEMNSLQGLKLYQKISPLTYLTKNDPPVWSYYAVSDKPLTAQSNMSEAIHHPGFGRILKVEMDKLKIECLIRNIDEGLNVDQELTDFLAAHLK